MAILSERIGRCGVIHLSGFWSKRTTFSQRTLCSALRGCRFGSRLTRRFPDGRRRWISFPISWPASRSSMASRKKTRPSRQTGKPVQNGKDVAVWNFGLDASRPVYVACRYAWTTVMLQRELPKEVRSCTITYNPRQTIAGLPAIEKIDCK